MTTPASIAVPIDSLHDDERNVRAVLGDIDVLAASIKQHGVLVPLLVVPNADGYGVIAGKRRLAAARKAGIDAIPCIVRDDIDAAAITAIENLQRQDFNANEEAAAYEQLAIAGLDDEAIAATLGVDLDRVGRGRKVASSKTATAVVKKYDLTMEQAFAIAEFDDDKEAVKRLTVEAVERPGMFDHTLSRMRQERERAATLEAKAVELEAKGVTVLRNAHLGYRHDLNGRIGLYELQSPKDKAKPMTPAQHKDCPGHVAGVSVNWDAKVEVTYGCEEPAKHGHKRRGGVPSRPGEKAKDGDKAKAERKKVVENNKAWRAAEPVRRAFVASVLVRKAPPKGTLAYAVAEILGDPDCVTHHGGESMLTELTDIEEGDRSYTYGRTIGLAFFDQRSEAQLPLVLFGMIAANREAVMDVQTWRQHNARAGRYLEFLVSCGYELSDVERGVVDMAKPKAKT